MPYRLDVTHGEHADDALRESLEELLTSVPLCTMATSGADGAHANIAFFAADTDLVLYFASERATTHCRNVAIDPRASATVVREPPQYGEHLQGVQLFGAVDEATGEDASAALACYQKRFPTFAQDSAVQKLFLSGRGPSALYGLRVESLKLLDEPRFGRRQYIEVAVVR